MSEDPFDTSAIHQDLGRRAARGGAILVAGQAVQFAMSVAGTIVLARLLSPADFGLVAMVVPFVTFVAFFRESGLHIATVQWPTVTHAQISTLFWFNLGLGVVLMCLLALLSPLVAAFFGREELVGITLAYAISLLVGAASVQHSALLTRQMAFGKLAATAIVSQLVGLVVAVTGAWLGLRYWALVAMALATAFAQTVLTWWMCGWMPGLPRRDSGIAKMLAFGGGLTISNLFNQVTQHIDTLLIGRALGAIPLGYYDRAKQLFVMPIMQLIGPLANVSLPALSRLWTGGVRYAEAYLRIQEKLLIATAMFSAFLVVYGDAFIDVVLGPQWLPVGPLLQALAVAGFVGPVSSSLSWLLVTQGRSADLAWWSPVSLALRCAAILLGYSWGLLGIAVSIAGFQYVSFLAFVAWVGRTGPVTAKMVLVNMAPSLAAAAVAVALGFFAKSTLVGWPTIAVVGAGATVTTAGFLLALWSIPAGRASLLDMWRLAKRSAVRAQQVHTQS